MCEEPEVAFHIKVLTQEVPLSTHPVMVLDRAAESLLKSSLRKQDLSAFTACPPEGHNYPSCITGERFCETALLPSSQDNHTRVAVVNQVIVFEQATSSMFFSRSFLGSHCRSSAFV